MYNNFIIIGDSITYGIGDYDDLGWATLFKKYIVGLDKTLTCSNLVHIAGYPGATSMDILTRLDGILDAFLYPDLNNTVILSIGINDTQFIGEDEVISLNNYKENIKRIINKVKESGSNIMVLGLTRMAINDNEINSDKYYDKRTIDVFNKDLELIEIFDKALEEVCTNSNAKYIPLFNVLDDNSYIDCLHPTKEGHKKIFDVIKNNIIK